MTINKNTLIGMDVEGATDHAQQYGCELVVIQTDGLPYQARQELGKTNKIYVKVKNGKVNEIAN